MPRSDPAVRARTLGYVVTHHQTYCQLDGVCAWWVELDEVDRARVLRDDDDGLLAEDPALRSAGHGVSVVPAFASEVDGRPEGWFWPPVLDAFVADLRGEPSGPGPGGRLCQECGEPVEDGEERVEISLLVGLSFVLHAECASTAAGDVPGP